MKRPYIVVLGEGFPRKDLLDYVDKDNRFGYWFFSMPNSFIVYSSVDANTIDAFIREKIGERYRYFISEIAISNRQGWMPKEHWAIINNNGVDKVYDLVFNGYYRSENNLPHESGVYCVYKGVYIQTSDTVSVKKLLYVGSAKDIHQRHVNHENKPEWLLQLSGAEELWFSYALVAENELARCEAALIFLNKPECNHVSKESFRYLDTIIHVSGRAIAFLKDGLVEKIC